MPDLLRMEYNLPFDDKLAEVQSGLLKYLSDNDLHGHVMAGDGRWKPEVGGVVVKAMLKGNGRENRG